MCSFGYFPVHHKLVPLFSPFLLLSVSHRSRTTRNGSNDLFSMCNQCVINHKILAHINHPACMMAVSVTVCPSLRYSFSLSRKSIFHLCFCFSAKFYFVSLRHTRCGVSPPVSLPFLASSLSYIFNLSHLHNNFLICLLTGTHRILIYETYETSSLT